MAIVLGRIDWPITTLTLRAKSATWHLLTHTHLLCVWELILKLILLIGISTLASAFICRGHICDSNGVGRFWIYSLTTRILYASLNALLVDVWSRVQRCAYIRRLHHLFVLSTTWSSSYRWYSKSSSGWNTVRLHVLHLLWLGWIWHAALSCSASHFLERIITTVSLTLGLIWCAKSTTCPFWLLLSWS